MERDQRRPDHSVAAAEPLGPRLRAARRSAGLTLREAAQALGVSAATWSAIENGHTGIGESRLDAAARLFGTDPDSLGAPAVVPADPATPTADLTWRDYPPLRLAPPLAGALEAFVELGYHGASIRDIAARANLSVPGIYHHWPTKQHLLVALLDLAMADLLRRASAARAEGDGPVERYSRLVECLALFHTHRRELGFIGASEMRSVAEPDRTRIAAARQVVQSMVDEEIAEGCRRALMTTPLPREAARAVVTMCTALPQWWSPGGPSGPEVVARQYVDFALGVVRLAH
ncbi:MAG: Transcriptional regulator, TetR family [Modestobacter sp.]|nr:Transcriptional regulator, TetR family [Modestobacter sp.]HEV7725929.1 TetR family transcriptional regulator [Modestobacter sp.]